MSRQVSSLDHASRPGRVRSIATKTIATLALTGTLVGVGAGVACAATPPVSPPASVGSSIGIHLTDGSLDTLVLTSVSGDNEGVPSVGSVLHPGIGDQDFEVTFRAAKKTTVTADYDVQDATGASIGTAAIKLSDDAIGDTSGSGTFTASDGSSLPLKLDSTGSGFSVVGSSGAPIQLNASTPLAAALVDNFCNTVDTGATCSFKPTGHVATTQENLLAEGYVADSGDSAPGTVSVQSGYNASTSDSWSISVTATQTLAGVLSEGITATYGQSVTWQNTFTAGDSISVNPGDTGYIWGQVPVITYTGTMQVKLNNTTYDIVNSQVTTPDPSRTLSGFQSGTWTGNDPLHSPSGPPASIAR